MATIAEQLTSLNTNLNTINTEVGNQETLIAQIKEKVESLPEAGSGGADLPELTNPATADTVVAGMDFIDGNGNRVVGDATKRGSGELSYRRFSDTEYSIVGQSGFYLDGIDMTLDAVDAYDTGYSNGLVAGGATSNIVSGTITSNEYGEIIFPMPEFTPKQIMVWNVREVNFDDYIGHDGVMLCAVKLETGHWIAHYMAQESGSYFIAQASAERGPFENDVQGYSWTNIYETDDSLVWRLGGASYEDNVNDFTDITLNYVLIG